MWNDREDYQEHDPYEDKELEKIWLSNQRLGVLAKLVDVLIKGVKLYAKDSEEKIRQQSLDFLEKLYQDLELK